MYKSKTTLEIEKFKNLYTSKFRKVQIRIQKHSNVNE